MSADHQLSEQALEQFRDSMGAHLPEPSRRGEWRALLENRSMDDCQLLHGFVMLQETQIIGREIERGIWSTYDLIESPSERTMLVALLISGFWRFSGIEVPKAGLKTLDVWDGPPFNMLRVWPQAEIAEHRVDFFVQLQRDELDERVKVAATVLGAQGHEYPINRTKLAQIVVECDGHLFHEKTKEQASKDKARDRDIQSQGFTLYRFPGSDIYKDPFGCAKEVLDNLEKTLRFEEP